MIHYFDLKHLYNHLLNIESTHMKVIWKRPDGSRNASPSDYRVITLESGANIWLHKTNTEWYPFRLSGDWAKEEGTNKLNVLINLLGNDDADWADHICEYTLTVKAMIKVFRRLTNG